MFNGCRHVYLVAICTFVPEYHWDFPAACKFTAFIPLIYISYSHVCPFIGHGICSPVLTALHTDWEWSIAFWYHIAATAAPMVGFYLHTACLYLQTLWSFLIRSEGASELNRRAIGSPPKQPVLRLNGLEDSLKAEVFAPRRIMNL